MATSYTGLRVQDTYNAIIKIGDNSNLSGTAKLLSDGLGNDSPLYLSGTRLGIGISPAYQFHTSGNAKIGGNLIISGNLTVNGTLTYLNVTDLEVEDPLIKLAKDNTSNTLDIGFFGKYVESATTKYTGLFWDASTDKFRLYEGLQVEPTTTVDVTGTGYTRSLLNADLEGNVTGTVSSLSNHDTNDLVEGSVNLYFTTTRARASFTAGTGVTITDGEIAIGQDVATDSDVTFGDITGSAISGTTGTFSGRVTFPSAIADRPQLPGGFVGINTGDGNFDIWGISTQYYPSHTTAANAWGIQWNGDSNQIRFVGGGDDVVTIDLDQGNTVTLGSVSATQFNPTNIVTNKVVKFDGTTLNDSIISDDGATVTIAGALSGTTGTFSGQVTIPETPTADAHAASKKYVDDATSNIDVAKRIEVTVKNVSGGSLSKGVVIHAAPTATPPSGNVIEVVAADANVVASMPAIGVLNETIADEAEGEAVMFGAVSGIDTSSFSIGDELYVSETAGAFTATKPIAFTSQVQKIAVVIKSHASNGLIKVFGAGRANDIPNRVDRDMNFTDDSELTFGDSSDLKIYHTTNNIVRINSGDLIFNSFVTDGDIKFQLDNGSGSLTEYMRLDGGTENIVFSKPISGNLTGNVTGNVTGDLTGDVTGNLTGSVTGGTISGTTGSFSGLVTGIAPTADLNFATKKYVDDNIVPAQSLSNVLAVGNTSGANDIIMADDQKINFGDDSDLNIKFDGTSGVINNKTGNLDILVSADDSDITFSSDNGSGGVVEYFRLDGSTNTIPFGRSPHLPDGLRLYFGNDTTNDASIRWDSTASQLFIDGESKFLNDAYVVGDLIVDTDTLFVDVSADKVGINNSAPGAMLTVGTAINANATGLEVNAGTGGGNIISRGAGYDNWFPYTNGENYYSSDTHNFRNTASSAAQLTIDSTGNGVFNGNVTGVTIIGTTGTFSDIVYVGDDASSNEGVHIKSGNGTGDYGVVRFYHGGTNRNTIHAFSQYWQSGTIYGHATDTLNLDGHAGVTIGPWNDIDVAFVEGGTNYFQRSIGIGQTTPLSSLHITQSIPSITLETSANSNDPVITLKSFGAITVEGAQMYYDNSVGTFHIQTTYPNDAADIVFHTATGADQGTNNVRMRIGGGGGVGIGDVSANGDLQFSNDVQTRKIVLYEGADNDYQFYGFGVEDSTFIYTTYLESDSHVFYGGASATTRTEIMRITTDTGVRVGTGSVDSKFKVEAKDTSNNIYAGFRVGYNGGSANYYDANTHNIRSGSSGTTYLTINSSGASFNKSIIIGTSGTYAAGAIYSDSNWGMILRAKQASPVQADFMFANSADVERLRITSTAATFAGEVNLVRGINMTAGTSTLYATDGALSYYSASNGVYLNGAGASGWLRLQASGVENDRNSINIYGSAGDYMNFRTTNVTRLTIDSNGDFQASVDQDKNYEFGRVHIGYIGHADHAGFSHIDRNSSTSYALLQNTSGQTYLNAPSGQDLRFRINNVDVGAFSGTLLNFGVGTNDPDAFMSGTNGISIVGNYASLGLSNGTTKWLTYLTTNADRYRIWNSTNNEVMTILLSGRVGIGNDSPNHLLELGASASQAVGTGYEMFSAGAFGVLFRNNYDCYIAGNTQYTSSGWVNKYGGRKSSIISLADGQIEFNIGTGTTAGVTSSLTVKQNTTTNGTTFFSPATGSASGDYTNVTNYPYKVDSATQSSDYWRIPHLSGHSAVAGVYNYETGKNVYWGEPSDTGTYEFRGRYINATSSNTKLAKFVNSGSSATFEIGGSSNSNYCDLIIASNSGTGEIFKAGTAYTSWGGALALNIYNSNGDICFHPSQTANIMKVKTSGITVTGSVTASGDVIAFSDKKVKTNIKTIDNGLQKVLNLRGVSYNRTDIDNKSDKIGVIAQEVKEVLPEVVSYDDEKDLLGVDYGKMAGVFIEAIKELKAEVDSLKQEIKELKK